MDRHSYRHRKENPSFSSTLLDVISRSIDERDDRKPVRNRQSIDGCFQVDKQIPHPSSAGSRRNSATGLESNCYYITSNTGSSGSNYRAASEAEMIYGFPARPRPIRTSISHEADDCNTPKDLKTKAKSGGMKKIYAYLKKGSGKQQQQQQPISPGSRLATFLYSLFSTTNTKKSKFPSAYNAGYDEDANRNPKSASLSSSACSLSRSCMSKTSVRYYPASVIVNEYSQALGHKSANGDRPSPPIARNGELKKHLTEKNRGMEETSINILKKYQRKVEYVFDSIQNNVTENDDEAWSYASSDLFELEHLSANGKDGCMQELPLYETTSVDANRAIANGLRV